MQTWPGARREREISEFPLVGLAGHDVCQEERESVHVSVHVSVNVIWKEKERQSVKYRLYCTLIFRIDFLIFAVFISEFPLVGLALACHNVRQEERESAF